MAVMASQPADATLLDQPHHKLAPTLDMEERNGSLEVNGHKSPFDLRPQPPVEPAPILMDDKLDPVEPIKSNYDAPTSEAKLNMGQSEDRDVPRPIAETSVAESNTIEAPAPQSADLAVSIDATPLAPHDPEIPTAGAAETIKPDPVEASAVEDTGLSGLRSDEPANSKTIDSSDPTAAPPAAEPAREPLPAVIPETVPEESSEAATVSESAVPERFSDPLSTNLASTPDAVVATEPKPDLDMEDAVPASIGNSVVAEPAETTQTTTVSDVPPATHADELDLHPASMSSLAIDASHTLPAANTTADTTMTETPPSPTKLVREREEDESDEPAAKRAKTDTIADTVEVKIAPPEKMDVDKPAVPAPPVGKQVSLLKENGEPKSIADDSLDGNVITPWQARKIRGILAGVKKTKAGGHFKASVESLWPGLWNDYCAKVSHPTDITTMEKRLKGDPSFDPYPTLGDFKTDLLRLYGNALAFNGEAHEVTKSGKMVNDQVLEKMATEPAAEVAKSERKEAPKQHPTRHVEPRAAAQPAPPPPPPPTRRQSKPTAASPIEKSVESPAFAIPPNNNGVPLIRRDSTKNADDRPKRPIHPPKSKDLGYEPKKKKKLSPDLRFCDEVLTELRKSRHYDFAQYFLTPVDPIALNIPNYHKVIKKPMDLQTMSEKLQTGQYSNSKDFVQDFQQIVKNCKTFNGEDSFVSQKATQLENLFNDHWAKKDDWMAKHGAAEAKTSRAAATSPQMRDDSEDEDIDSEPEMEEKANTDRLQALQRKLKEENDKVNGYLMDSNPDMSMVEISQTMVAMLQKQIIEERQKLAAAEVTTKKASKQKTPKAKKAGGAAAKKASVSGPAGGSGAATKKAGGGGKKKKVMGSIEKNVIASAISNLDGNPLEKAIEIIKKDTKQNENDSGELELDIESLSQDALRQLYEISIAAFPNLRHEKEQNMLGPAADPAPAPAKSKSSKPKKSKPMGKVEQERRLQQLNELRAQMKKGGSGSQEPIESIEGNGSFSGPSGGNDGGSPQDAENDSDEESSEEE